MHQQCPKLTHTSRPQKHHRRRTTKLPLLAKVQTIALLYRCPTGTGLHCCRYWWRPLLFRLDTRLGQNQSLHIACGGSLLPAQQRIHVLDILCGEGCHLYRREGWRKGGFPRSTAAINRIWLTNTIDHHVDLRRQTRPNLQRDHPSHHPARSVEGIQSPSAVYSMVYVRRTLCREAVPAIPRFGNRPHWRRRSRQRR